MRVRMKDVVFLLLVMTVVAAGIQSQPPPGQGQSLQERTVVVDLVRVINTAEMGYKTRSGGSFAGWTELSGSKEFAKAFERFSHSDPKLKDINVKAAPEVISGWRLRLTISSNAKSYFVVVSDAADIQCSYAVISDEEGLIRQARAIGCSGQ